MPAQGTSAVEVITIAAGTVIDRTKIAADGAPHAVSRDGCTGTETASWAITGTRVYVNVNTNCAGGVTRNGRGVLSFTQRYEWLDVRGMSSKDASGVSVARYAATDDTTGIPADVRFALPARTAATNNAMLAASAPLTLADIAEVATTADSGVAATWLMARTEGVMLSITGKQLEMLADQGAPSAVIDVVVAIAHPRVFAMNSNSREAEFKSRGQQVTNGISRGALDAYPYAAMYGYPYGFSYGWSPYSMYGYGVYSPYSAYYGYGYGYNSGYGYGGYYSPYAGYYPGSQPIIVVTRGSDGDSSPAPHGRVVKGSGYEAPRSSGSSSSSSSSGGSSSTSSSSGSSSGTGGASTGGASAGGSEPARTAVRKPPQE